MFRQLYRALLRELGIINRRSHKVHAEKELEKTKARLQYKKIQLIRAKQSTEEVDQELKSVIAANSRPQRTHTALIRDLVQETPSHLSRVHLENLKNVGVFLNSQRVYTELIERYNPGLTMSQLDNVSKSANRVGLKVPE